MVDKKCDYCDRVIVGSTKDQTEYLLLIHKLTNHPEKIKITEEKDG